MNYVIINGSYHKNGDISSLINNLIKGVKKSDKNANIEFIELIDKEIEFCKGCGNCNNNDGNDLGKCVQNDGVENILRSMLLCDRLVYATPIHQLDMTARLKKLNERSMPVLCKGGKGFPNFRNKQDVNKKGLTILSSGAPYPLNFIFGITKHPAKILNYFLKAFKCKKTKTLHAGGIRGSRNGREKFFNKIFKLGIEFGK